VAPQHNSVFLLVAAILSYASMVTLRFMLAREFSEIRTCPGVQ
jgi:hypothetical protein